MRLALATTLAVVLSAGCHSVEPEPTAVGRQVFTLTHLDGAPLPVPFTDPRGDHTLHSGRLVLAPSGDMWFVLHLSARDSAAAQAGKYVLSEQYRWASRDSLEFPFLADEPGAHPAEFFGRREGRVLTLRPQQPPSVAQFSLSAEFGGAHTWRFRQDSGFVR